MFATKKRKPEEFKTSEKKIKSAFDSPEHEESTSTYDRIVKWYVEKHIKRNHKILPLCLIGDPGVGKKTVVKGLCNTFQLEFKEVFQFKGFYSDVTKPQQLCYVHLWPEDRLSQLYEFLDDLKPQCLIIFVCYDMPTLHDRFHCLQFNDYSFSDKVAILKNHFPTAPESVIRRHAGESNSLRKIINDISISDKPMLSYLS